MSGKLLAIARREKSRGEMEVLDRTDVSPEAGVAGDLRGRHGERQVTVLSREAWDATCAALGTEIPWTTRRANLLVEGLELEGTAGQRLRIGAVQLVVTGETAPCPRMEEQHAGLRAALEPAWRGGVTCRVLSGGELLCGDPVFWDETS